MQTITPITMYPCPITGKLYKTERGAKQSAKKQLDKQEQEILKLKEAQKTKEEKEAEIDWVRLNIEDIHDFPRMLKKRAKELYEWDLKFTFSSIRFSNQLRNTHACPVGGKMSWGKEASYFYGWTGRARATLNGKFIKENFSTSTTDYIRKNFRGIYFGTGCPGRPNEYELSIDFIMYLDDFPKLKEQFNLYQVEHKKHQANAHAKQTQANNATIYVSNHEDIVKANNVIERVNFIMANKKKELYDRHIAENVPVLVPLAENFSQLKDMFS